MERHRPRAGQSTTKSHTTGRRYPLYSPDVPATHPPNENENCGHEIKISCPSRTTRRRSSPAPRGQEDRVCHRRGAGRSSQAPQIHQKIAREIRGNSCWSQVVLLKRNLPQDRPRQTAAAIRSGVSRKLRLACNKVKISGRPARVIAGVIKTRGDQDNVLLLHDLDNGQRVPAWKAARKNAVANGKAAAPKTHRREWEGRRGTDPSKIFLQGDVLADTGLDKTAK